MDGYYDSVATHRLRRPVSLVSFLNPLSQAVGRSLAAVTGLSLVIVDEIVEHRLGASAHEIVPDAGLAEWRRVEALELRRALEAEPKCLVVLGEGALTEPRSRELVLERSLLVYLSEDVEAIQRQLEHSRSPKLVTLLTEAANIPGSAAEKLEALLGLRSTEFEGAGFSIPVGSRPPRVLASELARRLQERGALEKL